MPIPFLLASLVFTHRQTTPVPDQIRIMKQRSASQSGQLYIYDDSPIAMGGKAYEGGVTVHFYDEGRITYFIPAGMKRFVVEVGVDDTQNPKEGHDDDEAAKNIPNYAILIDGQTVSGGGDAGTLRYGQLPIHLDLDVTGKRSVQFLLAHGAGVGDPMLYKAPKGGASAAEKSARPAGKKPELVVPADNAQVSGESVTLRWKPLDGAVAYGVSIVSLDASNDDAAPPKIWAATVRGGTSYAFPLKGLPDGQYLWSVIAFGARKPLGAFSAERAFTVER